MDWVDWRLASEIEKFPRAILEQRHGYRDVRHHAQPLRRLWGDFTSLRVRHFRRLGMPFPELLVAGTPCQAFSIAGGRRSLDDARGNLTLEFVRLVHALRKASPGFRWLVWENVPGILSTKDNAFGCFLGGLVGADGALHSPHDRDRWPGAGMVAGPWARVAWRVLDAQHFGLAQRRARVLLVAGFRDDTDPTAVLFERKGVRWDPPPRDGTRQETAGSLGAGAKRSGGRVGRREAAAGHVVATLRSTDGGSDVDHARGGHLVSATLEATAARSRGAGTPVGMLAFGGNDTRGPVEVATACRAKGGTGHGDFESETFVVGTLQHNGKAAGSATQQDAEAGLLIAHTLRAEGFDATEDGTGRGTPLVVSPVNIRGREGGASIEEAHKASVRAASGGSSNSYVAFTGKDDGGDAGQLAPTLRAMNEGAGNACGGGQVAIAFDPLQITSRENRSNPQAGDPCHTLPADHHAPAIAFDCAAGGKTRHSVGETSPTLRAGGHTNGQAAVCISGRDRGDDGRGYEREPHISDIPGAVDTVKPARVQQGSSGVRRLTPRECERLQGIPDDFTLIQYRGAPAADGPRYKVIGNSMAKTVISWIGDRLRWIEGR